MTIVYRRDLPRTDPRLGRHVHHDERSRNYAFDSSDIVITSVVHARAIGILDQGQVGSCTGNAGIGALATDPVFDPIKAETFYPMTESGALKLYSDAETEDGEGPYPPNDFGSCGLWGPTSLCTSGSCSGSSGGSRSISSPPTRDRGNR